jgi:histone H3/H4
LPDGIWKKRQQLTFQGVIVAKAKKAAPKKAAKGGPKEVLLVGSKVKAAIKDANCNTAGDAMDGLNAWVHWLIKQATARATENGRKTVRAHDFMAP